MEVSVDRQPGLLLEGWMPHMRASELRECLVPGQSGIDAVEGKLGQLGHDQRRQGSGRLFPGQPQCCSIGRVSKQGDRISQPMPIIGSGYEMMLLARW